MKKNRQFSQIILALSVVLFSCSSLFSQSIIFSEGFTQFSSPGTVICDNWTDFLESLDPANDYTSVTFSGSENATGFTCNDPVLVAQLANALNTGTTALIDCGGNIFGVNASGCVNTTECGFLSGTAIEFHIGTSTCSCSSSASLRPHIGNDNWGGFNSFVCGGPTQTMTLEFAFTPPPPPPVPTLGQWGLIILSLLMMSIVMVFSLAPKMATANGQTIPTKVTLQNFAFDKNTFFAAWIGVALVTVLGFVTAMNVFGYELTSADPIGAFVASGIVAYMITKMKK